MIISSQHHDKFNEFQLQYRGAAKRMDRDITILHNQLVSQFIEALLVDFIGSNVMEIKDNVGHYTNKIELDLQHLLDVNKNRKDEN